MRKLRAAGRTKPMKRTPRLALARHGEQRAADYLATLGYKILARNWRSPDTANEIDIVCEDGDCLVFVEVKTARTSKYGDPLTWITPRKQAAIITAAESYLSVCSATHSSIRFDAITIRTHGDTPLAHTIAAFTAE